MLLVAMHSGVTAPPMSLSPGQLCARQVLLLHAAATWRAAALGDELLSWQTCTPASCFSITVEMQQRSCSALFSGIFFFFVLFSQSSPLLSFVVFLFYFLFKKNFKSTRGQHDLPWEKERAGEEVTQFGGDGWGRVEQRAWFGPMRDGNSSARVEAPLGWPHTAAKPSARPACILQCP